MLPGMPLDLAPSEILNLFLARADELVSTRLVTSGGLSTSFNMKFERMKLGTFSISNPDEEQLRSFLLTFRQFVSKGEPILIDAVHNRVWQALAAGNLREQLAEARDHWKQQRRRGPMALIMDEVTYTPEFILDLWINGYYFHNDSRKAETLRRLDPVGGLFVRHVFLDHLVEATRYVVFLRNVIRVARSEGLLSV